MEEKLNPGDLVVVVRGALVRLHGTNVEHYTDKFQNALIIQRSYIWRDEFEGCTNSDKLYPDYLVLFSDVGLLYVAPGAYMLSIDDANDPFKLHGLSRGWH